MFLVPLIPEPENPHDSKAIAVYNENQTQKAGYVPKERIADVARLLEEEPVRCICIWETVKEKQRVNIRLLIARHNTRIKLP